MGQRLILSGKVYLIRQKISVLTLWVLVVLTLGIPVLKIVITDDFNVIQKTAVITTVADDTSIICITKATGDDGSSGNDKGGSNYSNSHFQNGTIHGKEFFCCYFIRYNHWGDNDDVHYDEEEDDIYDDDDDERRENKYEWEDV